MVVWRRPKNILRNVVPVASGWDTAPTDLANCTDGDLSTVTGTGSTNKVGAGYYGYLVFDLGSAKEMHIHMRAGMWTASGSVLVNIQSSTDNSTYYNSRDSRTTTSATEVIIDTDATVYGRYIRIAFYVSASSNTANAKIYEVMAWELTP